MSQNQGTQESVKGFVVGSDNGGKVWKVRVKQEGHPQNGKKLPVQSVCIGTTLKPGLDVEFSTELFGCFAHDVREVSQAEKRRMPKPSAVQNSEQSSLNLAVVKSENEYCLALMGCQTLEETRELYEQAGGDEEIVDLIKLTVSEENQGALEALASLAWMNISDEEGFGQMLESVLTQVFLAGLKLS